MLYHIYIYILYTATMEFEASHRVENAKHSLSLGLSGLGSCCRCHVVGSWINVQNFCGQKNHPAIVRWI